MKDALRRPAGLNPFIFWLPVALLGFVPSEAVILWVWPLAWPGLMAAGLLYMSEGLKQLLHHGRELNDVARAFAVMATTPALGLSREKLRFAPLERQVRAHLGTDRE